MADPSPDELDLGQTVRGFGVGQKLFARYTLKTVLGRGGMGIVWQAFDEELEREVALKFLPELVIHDRSVVQDLKCETRRSLELTHPHIVRIYDFVQDAQSACISMEFVDGDTLSNLRLEKPHKVFEVQELEESVRQLCDALQYAHSRAQIVHRDLKPANLMLNNKGDLKVTDFGISRSLADSVSMMTMGRGVSGTLPYMSPQQFDGERASHLDDIYSLGATIYELLTSRPPFHSGDVGRQVREKTPPSMAERREELGIKSVSNIPPHWQQTVAACLAKDPAQRPNSAVALRAMLNAERPPESIITDGQRGVTERDPALDRTRFQFSRKEMAMIGAAATLLMVMFAFVRNFNRSRDSRVAESHPAIQTPAGTLPSSVGPLGRGTESPTTGTKEQPWQNSIGMTFVPVPITGGPTNGTPVLFSVWETRVRDFAYFVKESGYDMRRGDAAETLEPVDEIYVWKQAGGDWQDPHFPVNSPQSDYHPVACVSWQDAKIFCEWLTKREHGSGRLTRGWRYRLPSDHEWSCAVGICGEESASQTPDAKDSKLRDIYPWGNQPSPSQGAGNYRGEESWSYGETSNKLWWRLEGYRDEHIWTAPVGRYQPNQYGIYDLGGNVWEVCEDECGIGRVRRGGSFMSGFESFLLLSCRSIALPSTRTVENGFRCVLAMEPAR